MPTIATKLKEVQEKASAWPEEAQEQLDEVAREIESGPGATYQATAEELDGIDDADRSRVATMKYGLRSLAIQPEMK